MRPSTPEPTTASTPTEPTTPPPGRVHTPAAPRFGPMLDCWEPYTPPRRSARLAAKIAQLPAGLPSRARPDCGPVTSQSPGPGGAKPESKLARFNARHLGDSHASTDPFGATNSGNGALSPDPASPATHSPPGLSPHRHSFEADPFLSSWPTPSKTPSKPKRLAAAANADLDPPPRLVFSTPSAPRFDHLLAAKRPPRLDLRAGESRPLTRDFAASKRRAKFDVYVDSNLRVPVQDEDDENPFISRPAKATPVTAPDVPDQPPAEPVEHRKMKEAVERNEGAIYVFRGKRVFRPFSPPVEDDPFTTETAVSDATSASDSTDDLGGPAKPVARLLWPEATKLSARAEQEPSPSKTKPTPLTLKSVKPTPKPRMMSPIPMQSLITGLSPSRPTEEPATIDRTSLFTTPSRGHVGPHLTPLTNILSRSLRTPLSHSKRTLATPVTASMASDIFSPRMLTITSPIVSENKLKPKSPFDNWRRTKSPTKRASTLGDKSDKLATEIEPIARPRLKRAAEELGNARKRIRGGG